MRVVHIDSGQDMRGGQWQALYLVRGLRERGHEVRIRFQGELARRARQEGFAPARITDFMSADLLHAHDARSHTSAVLRGTVPVVVSRRVAFPVRDTRLSRWKYSAAARYIAISRYVSEVLHQGGINFETISVVYDGVPIAPFREPRTGGPVLALSNQDTKEGIHILQQAAVEAHVPVKITASLADDLTDAGAFAYITGMQGLGSAAILAMSAGVPVIASAVGGLPEVVEDGRTGLLVENTVASVARALTRITADAEFGRGLVVAAHERASSLFSAQAMVNGTEEVYKKVLG